MILIVDNTQRKFRQEIRHQLLSMSIPCVVAAQHQFDEYMPAALTVVTEKYLLEDVRYLADLHGRVPVELCEDTKLLPEFIQSSFRKHYGDIFQNSKISRVLSRGKELLFCGKPLYLTKSERLILNMLQYAPRDSDGMPIWYTKEQLGAFCMKTGKNATAAVPVHICNMNAKTQRIIGRDIVECRRFQGYRLHMF